ncbi:unnamed protein product [Soboliphyme baturini]|uniref:Nucleoporin NUP35 n=1 Tax=Soboliphyme baturini TaxID=241478 RepID=A0A183J959_9BILA|nr:unnamed protein product [Soboliphyme baturini]
MSRPLAGDAGRLTGFKTYTSTTNLLLRWCMPKDDRSPGSDMQMFSVLTVNPNDGYQENLANAASTSTANVTKTSAVVRDFFPPLPPSVGHFIGLPTSVTLNTNSNAGVKQGFIVLDKKTEIMPVKSESLLPFRNNMFSQNSFPSIFTEETPLSSVTKVFNLSPGYQVNTKQCSSSPHESNFQPFQGSRPLTLQVNTVRGPAYVQLQHTRPYPKNVKGKHLFAFYFFLEIRSMHRSFRLRNLAFHLLYSVQFLPHFP